MKMEVKQATEICQQRKPLAMNEDPAVKISTNNNIPKSPTMINRNPFLHQYVNPTHTSNFAKASKPSYFYPNSIYSNRMGYTPGNYAYSFRTYPQMPYSATYSRQWHPRTRRAPQEDMVDMQDLQMLKSDILNKLSNVTCVLMEIGILTEDKRIDTEGLKNQFNQVRKWQP